MSEKCERDLVDDNLTDPTIKSTKPTPTDILLESTTLDDFLKGTQKLLEQRARRKAYMREYIKKYRAEHPEYREKCVGYAKKSRGSDGV